MQLHDILESAMILSFGISWPCAILRSWRGRTAKGKSLLFCILILMGYVFGILGKTITHSFNMAYWFYWLNLILVGFDTCLWFRNYALDKQAEKNK